jgi:hypothetical protein
LVPDDLGDLEQSKFGLASPTHPDLRSLREKSSRDVITQGRGACLLEARFWIGSCVYWSLVPMIITEAVSPSDSEGQGT